MIPSSRRRFIALLALVPAFLAGCGGRPMSKVGLEEVADLASDALLGTVLGPPPERRATMMAKPEPPLLQKDVVETILLSTDYAGFAQVSKGSLSEDDLKAIEASVVRTTGNVLKKQNFAIRAIPYPPIVSSTVEKSILATFTPVTEQGGSPEDKRMGRDKTFVLIRLTVSDPKTNTVLRVREFYSGREAGKRP